MTLWKRYIIPLCFIVGLSLISSFSYANIKNPKEEYRKIQREIKKRELAVKKARKREYSILAELEETNKKLDELKKKIRAQRKKIYRTKKQLSRLRKNMGELGHRIQRQKRWLKRKIIAMQKYGYSSFMVNPREPESKFNPDPMLVLMTSENINQMFRLWHYLKRLADYEYSLLHSYNEDLARLQRQNRKYTKLLKRLSAQEAELRKQEDSLRQSKKKKRQLLASIRREKSLYKKMIAELKAQSRKLRKLIEESEKQKFLFKGFSKRKRKLMWPVRGVVVIPYGSYRDPKFKTPVFHNGIHIKTSEDAIVRAVYGGKVVFADWFKGYGKVVIVNHGEGYHTVYANLSEIFLNKGDIIKEGDQIGRVGESSTINAPDLYFEVRYKGRPLNPLHWLKKK
ncbi:MAG: peptidoglycan DD-metalloendopeptidase family protein [Nitrospirae bacterium]|nr:peptidoglycan DD-metalloendopeptidase family protein [Nitrospirota bacterium]